jgi:hypothetical protein
MEREGQDPRTVDEGIHRGVAGHNKEGRANKGILIRVVEFEVNNYADVNVDEKTSQFLAA